MNRKKSVLLVLLGVVAVSWSHLQNYQIRETEEDGRFDMSLKWTGEGLVILRDNDSLQEDGAVAPLPPKLRPIFFQKIPVNMADAELLQTLPGIGPVTAAKIVALRREKVRINSPEELLNISGLGQKKVKHLSELLSFE